MRALTKQTLEHFKDDISDDFQQLLDDVLTEISNQELTDMEVLIQGLQDSMDKEGDDEQEIINETFDGKQRVETHVFTNSSIWTK